MLHLLHVHAVSTSAGHKYNVHQMECGWAENYAKCEISPISLFLSLSIFFYLVLFEIFSLLMDPFYLSVNCYSLSVRDYVKSLSIYVYKVL